MCIMDYNVGLRLTYCVYLYSYAYEAGGGQGGGAAALPNSGKTVGENSGKARRKNQLAKMWTK